MGFSQVDQIRATGKDHKASWTVTVRSGSSSSSDFSERERRRFVHRSSDLSFEFSATFPPSSLSYDTKSTPHALSLSKKKNTMRTTEDFRPMSARKYQPRNDLPHDQLATEDLAQSTMCFSSMFVHRSGRHVRAGMSRRNDARHVY